MSVEFAPVAVAKWEQELIDSVRPSRTLTLDKIECAWCYNPATWKITDPFGIDYACTVHGTEWFPELFPESDTTPVEEIVRVALMEPERVTPVGVKATTQYPWYPLMGHRKGLRMNDLVTLASAFYVLSTEGGCCR